MLSITLHLKGRSRSRRGKPNVPRNAKTNTGEAPMNSLYYALSVFAILYVIWWCMQNERDGEEPDGSKGLLAMRMPDKGAKRGGQEQKERRGEMVCF